MSAVMRNAKQRRNVERLRERGGRETSVALCRTAAEALELLCQHHELTRRDAIEAALIAAAVQGSAFTPYPHLRLARERSCSVDELREMPHTAPTPRAPAHLPEDTTP